MRYACYQKRPRPPGYRQISADLVTEIAESVTVSRVVIQKQQDVGANVRSVYLNICKPFDLTQDTGRSGSLQPSRGGDLRLAFGAGHCRLHLPS